LNDFLQNFDFGEFSPRSSSTPLGEGSDAPPKNIKRQSDDDGDGNQRKRVCLDESNQHQDAGGMLNVDDRILEDAVLDFESMMQRDAEDDAVIEEEEAMLKSCMRWRQCWMWSL
jgi:hypothetical protein